MFQDSIFTLNHTTLHFNDFDSLTTLLPVFSKYKKFMENGTRLENLSWRLWHQQQKFVPPNLSLSAGKPCHEVSQKKQTQHDQVLNEKHNMIEYPSTSTTPTTTTNNNNSRTTTPSLTDSYQHDDEEDEDDDYLYDEEDDDDYLYDDEDDYLYDDDDEEDDYYDEEEELRKLKEAIRLHKEKKLNQYSFEKTPPRPLTQQPSLLSALFKTPPSSNSSSTTTTSSSSTSSTDLNQQTYRSHHHHHPSYPSLAPTSTTINNNNNKDALFKEELTESLRNNVLWEHLQQKSIMYTKRNQRSYYRHPSHTTSTTTMNPSLPTQHYHHPSQYRSLYNHNTNTNNTNSSDHGWLEHFHGW